MKKYLTLLCLSNILIVNHNVFAQGTAFTYQGQLQNNGNPAGGNYDFTFALYNNNSSTNTGQVGSTLTNLGVGVTNGLFIVTLDFGVNFPGASRWLAIGVRTNGSAAFTALSPLQEVTPTPYAIYTTSAGSANTATSATSATTATSANSFTGSLAGNVTGTQSSTVVATVGGVTAANVASGANSANAATSANAANTIVKRDGSGNFAAGTVTANLAGSASLASNVVSGIAITNGFLTNATVTNSLFGGSGGGLSNLNASQLTSGVVPESVLPGFQASSNYASVAGGQGNSVGGSWAAIGGGNNNTNIGNAGTIAGGQDNYATTGYQPAIGGGYGNQANNSYSTIGGGDGNTNTSYGGTIAGGQINLASGQYQSTVGGGYNNQATNSYATVPGGYQNIAGGQYSFAAGYGAEATNDGAFVWADAEGSNFVSTRTNQFSVRANGGVLFSTGGAGVQLDGVSVLTAAPGLIQESEINDGGAGAYQSFQQSVQAMGGDTSVTFSNLYPVTATNGSALSLVLNISGSPFGTVVGFSGSEGMSQAYSYVVEVSTSSTSVTPSSEIGLTGSLTYTRNGRTTTFGGIITGCTLASSVGSTYLYTLQIESPLAYLALNTGYQIYQNATAPATAVNVYEGDYSATATESLSSSYTVRNYTEYAETDLNFFNRILENEGVFYFFNQSTTPPKLILGDATAAYLSSPNSPFNYYGNTATNITAGTEYIRTFQNATYQSTLSSTVDTGGGTAETATGAAGVGGYYEFGNSVATTAYNQHLANVREGIQTAARAAISGSATAPDLRAGYTFTLSDQTGAALSGSYVVTSVHHAGFMRVTNGVSTFFYGNEFTVIPAGTIYRSPLKTPKPQAQPCTGQVLAPSGEDIYVDQYGRVKVLFDWDHLDQSQNNYATDSAWVLVASPWAHDAYGMIFLPRAGDEVLVSFLGGDPDQPFVSGSLYNAENPVPYALPQDKYTSTIKTQSSTGTGFNELRFNDTSGSEEVYLQAQKDMNMKILNNLTETVDENMTFTVDNDFALTANNQITLNGPLAANGATVLSGPLTVSGGTQSIYGAVGIDTAAILEGSLTVDTNIYLVDHPIYLRGSSGIDHNHGLAYSGPGVTNFAPSVLPDGPVLWGYTGGVLGVNNGGAHSVLAWTNGGVSITGGLTATLDATGGFGSAAADIENLDTTVNCSPALRLIAHGSPAYGALCVSTAGPVSSTNTYPIASFGNADLFVSWLDNNGNWYAKGSFNGNTFNSLSDRNAKENFESISPRAVLDKVASLPLSRWNYKQDKTASHIGPMAQDFHATFQLGQDDKHIATVDEEGVALAAIQGLNEKLNEKDVEISKLKEKAAQVDSLEQRLNELEEKVKELADKK